MIDKIEVGKTYVFVSEEAKQEYINQWDDNIFLIGKFYNEGFTIGKVNGNKSGYVYGDTKKENPVISFLEYHLFKPKEEKPSYQTSKAFLSEESKVEQLENKIKRLEAQVKDQDITIKAFKIVVETLQKVLGEKKDIYN